MKKKLLLMVTMLLLSITVLSGCGNRQIFDTTWKYDRAVIDLKTEVVEVKVAKWNDYEGNSVQIITPEGKAYLTSYNNVVIIKD